jgi:hypothetical protein
LLDSIRKACPNCSCTTCIKHPKTTEEGYSIDKPSLPPIPTTYGKIRSVILEGTKSLIPILAHPTIRTLGNHAFVLPSQCIRHFLANGNSPMLFNKTTARDVYISPKDTPRRIAIASKIGSLQNDSSTPKHLYTHFICRMERQLRIFEIKQGIEDRKHLGLDHDYFQEGKENGFAYCNFPGGNRFEI